MIALIDLYRKELFKVNGFAESTVDTYLINVKAFCGFITDELNLSLKQVNGTTLMKWIRVITHTGVGSSRIESHHYALKSFFGFLKKTGYIRKNPADVLPLLIKRKRNRTNPICASEARILLESFDQTDWHSLRNYTMLSLLWALGLRTAELTGLTVGNFEPHHGKRIGLLRIRGKNKKQRALFVVDRLYDTLVRYLAHRLSPKKKTIALFTGTPGKPISNSRVQKLVKEQAKALGIADVTPRAFRHAFATEMYHQNVPLSAIQAMMGHASIAETSTYVHVSDKLKQLALDAVSISRRLSWE